jgi:hypothetical protein
LVFVTKHRHQVFTTRHMERMEEIMRDVCADFGAELREFNGGPGTSTAGELPAHHGHLRPGQLAQGRLTSAAAPGVL